MKSLSLSRPLILMVIGVPGSGKSFFARQFSDTFAAPLVSYDYIRSRLFENPAYNREEEAIVYSLAGQQINELLKTQKTFIVDGGLNAKSDRYSLAKLGHKFGYGTLAVWVQTDESASKLRATRRNSKRPGDIYNASLSEKQFIALSRELVSPSPQEPYVVISGKHTYATQAKVVLKKLVLPREEQALRSAPKAPPTHEQQAPTSPHRRVIIN